MLPNDIVTENFFKHFSGANGIIPERYYILPLPI
jgi:hypothetical protein